MIGFARNSAVDNEVDDNSSICCYVDDMTFSSQQMGKEGNRPSTASCQKESLWRDEAIPFITINEVSSTCFAISSPESAPSLLRIMIELLWSL